MRLAAPSFLFMNVYKAILFTLISSLMFAAMAALVRFAGETAPVGQVVFFRAAFGIVPITLFVLFRGELLQMVRTRRVLGHAGRGLFSIGGMFLNFASLARLPIVDATALSFASPLASVVFSAIFLKERVRIYRWSLPFGWIWPSPMQLAALIATGLIGGLSHIFLTESYRNAPQSVVAPFNYTTMLWALVFGYVFFGEIPVPLVFIGASIIAAAGLIVVFRERQLGKRDIDAPPPAP
jgi:drug/metabolite transporter (DMT)-like permease